MKILDNKKDFYDYLQGIYGIDEKVFFDRRNSITFDYAQKISGITLDPEKLSEIIVRIGSMEYTFKREIKNGVPVSDWEMPKEIKKYYSWLHQESHENPRRLSDSDLDELYNKKPARYGRNMFYVYGKGYVNSIDTTKYPIVIRIANGIFINPILSTFPAITKFIEPTDVWNEIYNYITSQIDKPIVDNRTDIQHLESAGFDKKTSFRKVK